MIFTNASPFGVIVRFAVSGIIAAGVMAADAMAQQKQPSPGSAKALFGAVQLPSNQESQPIGFYAKGCMAGGVALPADGPTWQVMRMSRNRRWGNPATIALIEKLSRDARQDGWPGLLIGDMSQPRGGPMFNGHASHQIGLDFDAWFRPMPAQRLTIAERETYPFVSLLQKNKFLTVDDRLWTQAHARLLMRAASYPEVERIFVNPAIKKKMCDTWKGDRTNLGKIRAQYGHDEHFHVRLHCPPGATACKPQAPVAPGDGCDKSLAWWFSPAPWAKPKPPVPGAPPPKPPREVMVSDLPAACAAVLHAPSISPAKAKAYGVEGAPSASRAQPSRNANVPQAEVPVQEDQPSAE
ncbi:penicillin-insensitive murein endopeptidase [Oryzifoliimicrobium ureilyticus]|uniref:penicillin-insensitive murein endopeptidase n=1 Tax=Oryzifoliimicrobium ureilyticus TaxID=3113724 RepID=UPI003076197F